MHQTYFTSEKDTLFAEVTQTVTYSDKHMRERSSGVFRHINRRDDPVSLLSPQPVGRGASLMFSKELDNPGWRVPDSWQHFLNANLKRKGHTYHNISYYVLHWIILRNLSFDIIFAMPGLKVILQSAVKWKVFSAKSKIPGVSVTTGSRRVMEAGTGKYK